jgi:hypothetical protein
MAASGAAPRLARELAERIAMAAITTAFSMLFLSLANYFSADGGLPGCLVGPWVARRVLSGGRRYYATLIASGSAAGLMGAWADLPAGCGPLRLTQECAARLAAWTFAGAFLGVLLFRSEPESPIEKRAGSVTGWLLALLLLLYFVMSSLVRY